MKVQTKCHVTVLTNERPPTGQPGNIDLLSDWDISSAEVRTQWSFTDWFKFLIWTANFRHILQIILKKV